ncbi:MAG: phage tail tube protein, partial [Mycobacterium sp.]
MAAANTTQGAGAWVALGEETTEGTSVTPDIFAAFRTETLKLVAPREGVEPNGMPGGAIPTQRDTFVKEERVEGDLVTTARFDDQLTLILLKHLFGSVTTGGAGPYTYTYTPTRAVPTKPSITVELVRGTGGSGIDRAETFAGCRVARLQLKVTTGGVVECTWGILGISSEGLAAPTSATFETGRTVILHNHATNFSFNGSQM